MKSLLMDVFKKTKIITTRRNIMWTKPEYSDMRFGFEVTMYVCNR